jgi:hypothetical protein
MALKPAPSPAGRTFMISASLRARLLTAALVGVTAMPMRPSFSVSIATL